ncbi:MAG: sigma-E factor negative regulatory protein [Pseudomonadota bacterium]
MKARISELMDGELERHEAAGPLDALRAEGVARDTWRSYHLIGDAMRDTRMLSAGFAARVAAKLAQEPTVMAPLRIAPTPPRPRWQLLSAAASLAAVALVGWVAFGLQEGAPQVAQAPQQNVALKETPQVTPPQVAPPDTANDYLYAHQGYSPRNSLQGVAPYVRMVSGEAGARKQ